MSDSNGNRGDHKPHSLSRKEEEKKFLRGKHLERFLHKLEIDGFAELHQHIIQWLDKIDERKLHADRYRAMAEACATCPPEDRSLKDMFNTALQMQAAEQRRQKAERPGSVEYILPGKAPRHWGR